MSIFFHLIATAGVAMGLCLLLTPLARRMAVRWRIMDHPDPRRVHPVAIPRLGGLAIFISSTAATVLGIFVAGGAKVEYGRQLWGLLGGSCLMVGIGVYDDITGASATVKLAVQIAAAYFLVHCGLTATVLANPLYPPLFLGWFGIPFTIAWVVLITNTINLIDGLDGLAAGISAMVALILLIVGLSRGSVITAIVAAGIIGSTVGFLRYNFYPATIFMGDGGSLFLGFALAGLSLLKPLKTVAAVALFVPLIAFGLPFLETSSTVLRRFLRRRGVLQADKGHIHHLLLRLGMAHRSVVWLLYGVSGLFGLLALGFAFGDARAMFFLSLFLSMVASLVVYKLHRMGRGNPGKKAREVEATTTERPIFHRGRR